MARTTQYRPKGLWKDHIRHGIEAAGPLSETGRELRVDQCQTLWIQMLRK
jgi:hypothetical protein